MPEIVSALIITISIGFVASLVAQLADEVNALGWSTGIIFLLLVLGLGYFIEKPEEIDYLNIG